MCMKENCVKCFKNLSIESRAKIYMSLVDDAKCENEITKMIGLRQPTVSYHLRSMLNSGLLTCESKGNLKYFSVNKLCPFDNHSCIANI